jgi:hypothetical protein
MRRSLAGTVMIAAWLRTSRLRSRCLEGIGIVVDVFAADPREFGTVRNPLRYCRTLDNTMTRPISVFKASPAGTWGIDVSVRSSMCFSRMAASGAKMTMQSATSRIEDRRRKIGARSGGGSEIGFASFQVLSVAKSLPSQSNLSTAAPVGWRLRWGNSHRK